MLWYQIEWELNGLDVVKIELIVEINLLMNFLLFFFSMEFEIKDAKKVKNQQM